MSRSGQEIPDVMYDMRSTGWVLYHPPCYEGDSQPPKDGLTIHVASHGAPGLVLLSPEKPMLA